MTAKHQLVQRGRVWCFGDDVMNDGQVMDIEMTRQMVYDPVRLAPLAMGGLDPSFAAAVRPGDFVVAGHRFGQGPMHIQGPLALAALKVAVLSESMARSFFRLAVSAGLKVLPFAEGAIEFAAQGDEIEVDFVSGRAINYTSGQEKGFRPLAPAVLELVAAGGEQGWLRQQAPFRSGPQS
ncbi:hypothetical protein [Bordetella sp. BOR01]|uniref:hypothetical protein n=1 Tax=Bordetella sp. BOR01 TaxID=2854779 RepID=UPI001C44E1DB|nr:hypothetical protein [Bordetella sp. BOR01]MBV7486047.1 hypothetical protein [Bordetella sp. BOR01]